MCTLWHPSLSKKRKESPPSLYESALCADKAQQVAKGKVGSGVQDKGRAKPECVCAQSIGYIL